MCAQDLFNGGKRWPFSEYKGNFDAGDFSSFLELIAISSLSIFTKKLDSWKSGKWISSFLAFRNI